MSRCDSNREKVINRLMKKPGLRSRIDAKCCECIYDPFQPGTWRKQVELCTAQTCPLFRVRPRSQDGSTKENSG
jgi:hypothetical protein